MQHNSHFVGSYSRKQILINAAIRAVRVLSQAYVSMAVMMAYCLFYELSQEIWLNWLTNNPVIPIYSDTETWKKELWLSISLDLLNFTTSCFHQPHNFYWRQSISLICSWYTFDMLLIEHIIWTWLKCFEGWKIHWKISSSVILLFSFKSFIQQEKTQWFRNI